MKIKLVFDEWRNRQQWRVSGAEYGELAAGDFHSGTIFMADLDVDEEQAQALQQALNRGYAPVFYVIKPE